MGAVSQDEQTRARWSRGTVLRVALLLLVVVGVVTASASGVLPDVDTVQREVRGFGRLAPLVYVLAYAVLVMFPVPAGGRGV